MIFPIKAPCFSSFSNSPSKKLSFWYQNPIYHVDFPMIFPWIPWSRTGGLPPIFTWTAPWRPCCRPCRSPRWPSWWSSAWIRWPSLGEPGSYGRRHRNHHLWRNRRWIYRYKNNSQSWLVNMALFYKTHGIGISPRKIWTWMVGLYWLMDVKWCANITTSWLSLGWRSHGDDEVWKIRKTDGKDGVEQQNAT